MWTILEPLYYVSYATLVWGDLGFINFVDNTYLSQNQLAWLQWGRINDSPGPEVMAFLAGGRNTKLWGREAVAPCAVVGFLVSYLLWGAEEKGLVGAPFSEGGICRASVVASWVGESLGTRAEEALCLRVRLYERAARDPRVRAIWKWRNGPRVCAQREVSNGRRTEEWDARGGGGRVNRGWNQNRGTGWHYEEAARWQRDSQWEGACEMGEKWGS